MKNITKLLLAAAMVIVAGHQVSAAELGEAARQKASGRSMMSPLSARGGSDTTRTYSQLGAAAAAKAAGGDRSAAIAAEHSVHVRPHIELGAAAKAKASGRDQSVKEFQIAPLK